MRDGTADHGNVSRFIADAVEGVLEPLRPRCSGCGVVVYKSWRFCPECGTGTGL